MSNELGELGTSVSDRALQVQRIASSLHKAGVNSVEWELGSSVTEVAEVADAEVADAAVADAEVAAAEAKAGLDALIKELQADAPRIGLGAPTGAFIDHVAGVVARYGEFIFTCFDFPLLGPDASDLERFFGASKAQIRHALGTSSTAGSVAKNLGPDYLEGFATAWLYQGGQFLEALVACTEADYARARQGVRAAEQAAILRRSRRRDPQPPLHHIL